MDYLRNEKNPSWTLGAEACLILVQIPDPQSTTQVFPAELYTHEEESPSKTESTLPIVKYVEVLEKSGKTKKNLSVQQVLMLYYSSCKILNFVNIFLHLYS